MEKVRTGRSLTGIVCRKSGVISFHQSLRKDVKWWITGSWFSDRPPSSKMCQCFLPSQANYSKIATVRTGTYERLGGLKSFPQCTFIYPTSTSCLSVIGQATRTPDTSSQQRKSQLYDRLIRRWWLRRLHLNTVFATRSLNIEAVILHRRSLRQRRFIFEYKYPLIFVIEMAWWRLGKNDDDLGECRSRCLWN